MSDEAPRPMGKDTETRIIEAMKDEKEKTRSHISFTVGTIAHNTEITKTRMEHVKAMVRRLLTKFGIGTDDIL